MIAGIAIEKIRRALMSFGCSRARALLRCPGGTFDNSPAFQRRDSGRRRSSPKGTAECKQTREVAQPSFRDWATFVRSPGVETPYLSRVAQVSNLLFRRFPIGRPSECCRAPSPVHSDGLPIGNRRNSRLETC